MPIQQIRDNKHEAVFDRIRHLYSAFLHAGKWAKDHHLESPRLVPFNPRLRRPYAGDNLEILISEIYPESEADAMWATQSEWRAMGFSLRRDAEGVRVNCGPSSARRCGSDDAPKVFNAFDVCEPFAMTASEYNEPVTFIPSVEDFIARSGAVIERSNRHASYNSGCDVIRIPDHESPSLIKRTTMSRTEAYYATLLHELIHWTGAPNRLCRDLGRWDCEAEYALEEAIAEVGSAYLCADLGVTTDVRQEHAYYLYSWLPVSKQNVKVILRAATAATEAVNFLEALQVDRGQIRGRGPGLVDG